MTLNQVRVCLKIKVVKKRKGKKFNKYKHKAKESLITKEFSLTGQDRITYSYKKDGRGKYLEVTNVSYEATIRNKWITIVRYDSSHGYLHRHTRISLSNESETTNTDRVIKRGSHHKWLTWAIKDLRANFVDYRRLFFKRSKTIDNYY